MNEQQSKYIDEIVDDGKPWFAIRLFTLKLDEVTNYFRSKGLEVFTPMHYVDEEDARGRVHRYLRPVVRNFLFVKQTIEVAKFKRIVYEANHKIAVYTKSKENKEYYLIPSKEMYEFRIMCNPDISIRKYITPEEAAIKPGDLVCVKFGPLKGITGRLVRSSKKYYLLKEIPGVSVMLKVTRWCCEPLDTN
ncbi:UpxY family transcription antiterminator [Prevotella ihumii]|uniref:UpxY family transcription antiterminator n=1 Tax=Prevotella ihumii TaxID=1917878 RepID=UPI00098180E2|nr:UpxY family transcription antiterminator [Prevotella ihumii]